MHIGRILVMALIFNLTLFGALVSTIHLLPPILKVYATGNWLIGWSYRNRLTIDSSLIDESLIGFPVLVKLDSSVFNFSNTQENGEDVRFTSSDGVTLLKHEFEHWNKTAEKAEIWVKIPLVSSTSDTNFYLYYGNPVAPDAQDPTNVWDGSYAMVQHMNDYNATHILDSTINNYDGVKKAANEPLETAQGQINSAQDFDGNDYIECGDVNEADNATQLTISIWANTSGNGPLVSKYTDPNHRTHIYHSAGVIYWNLSNDTTSYGTSASLTGWHQYVMVFNGSETGNENRLKCYVDGIQQSLTFTGTIPPMTADTGTNQLELGRQQTAYFTGQLDEIRISDTPRSTAWIKAQSQSVTDQYVIYEHAVAVLGPPISSPTNKTLLCLSATSEPELTATFSVKIRNEGSIAENVNVTIYLVDENDTQTPAVGSLTVLNLIPEETRSVLVPICAGDNTGIRTGWHKIRVKAEVLNDTCPNYDEATTTSSILNISITGDIASSPAGLPLRGVSDGRVNMLDVAVLARDFGCKCGDPKYVTNCDIFYDLKIDMRDLATVARHYGETDP